MGSTLRQQIVSMQKHLLNFAYQLTGNREQADDLLQDTTLKVLDSQGKYHDDVNFKGWVFTIMRNIFVNNYRKSVRQSAVIDNSQDLFVLNFTPQMSEDTPEGMVSAHDILKLVRGLSDDFRLPFTLYVQGYRYSEIADRLHLPLGTIKSRIHFARCKLRGELGRDYREG